MLKIVVFETNWFNSSVEEFNNVFDAIQYARELRTENIEDRKVEIRSDLCQIISMSENLRKTDAVASGTYVDYDSLHEPEEASEDEYEVTRMPCCNNMAYLENNEVYHSGLIEEAREWVDQYSREIGFDSMETEDTTLYEQKLEEYYVYLCKLKGVKPLDYYISK